MTYKCSQCNKVTKTKQTWELLYFCDKECESKYINNEKAELSYMALNDK